MADGVDLNPGLGGKKVDTEDLGARGHLQRVKLVVGALDVDGPDVSATDPLPITGAVAARLREYARELAGEMEDLQAVHERGRAMLSAYRARTASPPHAEAAASPAAQPHRA